MKGIFAVLVLGLFGCATTQTTPTGITKSFAVGDCLAVKPELMENLPVEQRAIQQVLTYQVSDVGNTHYVITASFNGQPVQVIAATVESVQEQTVKTACTTDK